MSSYNFRGVPRGYKTELALIIAPYFDIWFANKIKAHFNPLKLQFVVDDGASEREIERISTEFDAEFRVGFTSGLMHLKCYYFRFSLLSGNGAVIRRLIYGSANATKAAIDGKINAELIADIDIHGSEHSEIAEYFEEISSSFTQNSETIRSKAIDIREFSQSIFLPSFCISPVGPSPGFDAWLQRGKLVAKYDPPQQFLNVRVDLRKALPRDRITQTFAEGGLMRLENQNAVFFRYISIPEPDNDEESEYQTNWKARYCIWTHLGYWISEECYKANSSILLSNRSDLRKNLISEILNNGRDLKWIENRKNIFINSLKNIANALRNSGEDPSEYIFMQTGYVDRERYERIFDRKIEHDFSLASNEDFAKRYISGYEFIKVPQFRGDEQSWMEFVHSWCQSISVKAIKGAAQSQSLLVKAVCAGVEPEQHKFNQLSDEAMYELLKKLWAKDNENNIVWVKWSDDELYYRGTIISRNVNKINILYDDGSDSYVKNGDILSVGNQIESYFSSDSLFVLLFR